MTSAGDQKRPDPVPEDAPDPEEDDLDDLDDVLDEFSATKITPSSTNPATSGPGRPITGAEEASDTTNTKGTTEDGPPVSEEDFTNQLQSGMADMLKELETNPEMAKQFEEMMAQFGPLPPGEDDKSSAQSTQEALKDVAKSMDLPTSSADAAVSSPSASSATKPSPSTNSEDKTFQDTIRRTMDRMNASSSAATAASASKTKGPSEDDLMSALLAEMGKGGAAGEGGDDALSKMLLSMMEQLTNKDILYEPMKELDSKYPAWLKERSIGEAKEKEITTEDRTRYEQQRALVREIVERFERPGYSDDNPQDREIVVERMQKMQAAGSPPSDLVGDMAGAEAIFNDMDAGSGGCPQQ
ncbi:MAG: Peroxisome chaperone and import receptor [Chrysothrix sp. TS-e1954]|nr:MAG: Peroxisome chaperone and import receptor [Chrysothrix sp. TS-e1954]